MRDIDNINHVGMAVRDLDSTVATFERMGFQLTPYSPHSAAWKPGEPVRPLGSGNRCIMFAATYLEILGNEDRREPSPRISAFVARHQGAHIVCFNTDDPGRVDRRLRSSGIETSGVIPLQREIDTPAGTRTAKFERIQFAPANSPEGYIQAARHLTPEYIYQRRYIMHPNGCEQLSETTIVVDDLDRSAEMYGRYLDTTATRANDTARFTFALGTQLTLVHWKAAAALLPGTLLAPLPCIAAVTFRASDLGPIRERLSEQDFAVIEIGDRLLVPAEQASGVAILFEASR